MGKMRAVWTATLHVIVRSERKAGINSRAEVTRYRAWQDLQEIGMA